MNPRVTFGWPMVGDSAALSGGSWLAGQGLAKLQTGELGDVARSSDALAASTQLAIDHGAATSVAMVALVRHNLRSTAQWQIKASSSVTMTPLLYDSGLIDVWGVQWATGVLPSGHPNAATRLYTDTDIDALDPKRDAVHVFTEVSARYWTIAIVDTANADGYVEAGRLVMAPQYQPSLNYSVGADFGFVDGTVMSKTLAQVRYYSARPKGRALTMTFQNLPDSEAVSVFRDIMETLGINGQLYVIQDPTDTVNLQRKSFLATIRQLGSIQYGAAGYSTLNVSLDEVL